MKKPTKIALICAGSLLAAGFVFAVAALAMGFTGSEEYETFIKTFPGTIQEIHADMSAGSIHFYRAKGDEVEVLYYDNENHYYSVEEKDQRLNITKKSIPWYKNIANWFHFGEPEYGAEIGIPSNYQGTLVMNVGAGNIYAEDLSCLELKIESSSGSVRLEEVDSRGSVIVKGGSGSIRLAGVSSQDKMEISNSSGSLHLNGIDCGGDLTVRGISGSQELSEINLKGSMTASASSGSIKGGRINCAKNFSVELVSGSINLNELAADEIQAQSSSGGIRMFKMEAQSIQMRATSGSINGSVIDAIDEYTVFSETTSGGNHLASGSYGGSKILDVRTTSGSIRFEFDDKIK